MCMIIVLVKYAPLFNSEREVENCLFRVILRGAPLDTLPKWTVGTVSLKNAMTWSDFEASIETLLVDHWHTIER